MEEPTWDDLQEKVEAYLPRAKRLHKLETMIKEMDGTHLDMSEEDREKLIEWKGRLQEEYQHLEEETRDSQEEIFERILPALRIISSEMLTGFVSTKTNGGLQTFTAMQSDLHVDDLVQFAATHLLRKLHQYDPQYRFSTWVYNQSILGLTRPTQHTSTIYIPDHVRAKMRRAKRAGKKTGIDPLTQATIESSMEGHEPSLDDLVGEGDTRRGDLLPAKDEMVLERLANSQLVGELLDALSEHQREVITYRYGLDGEGERTLEDTGSLLDPPVTRERVRQIEIKALRKMRYVALARHYAASKRG